MSYLSLSFPLFVIFLLFIYYLMPSKKQWLVLLSGSLFFYLCFDPAYFLYFLVTILSTYAAGILIEKYPRHRKLSLILCICLNAGIWFVIKCHAPILSALQSMIPTVPLPQSTNWLVPVGISYYILQSVGYLVDVYRGEKAERNIFKYTLFLAWFPAIVQGPISRYRELAPQFTAGHRFDYDKSSGELLLILFGLIKKIVIADNVARIANYCFQNASTLEGFTLYIGAVAYSLQLYFDFSGCVDLCRGTSGLFGIQLRQNFASPYLSQSIKEFWGRWHMSLTSWLRDYIYIPLGGNRKGTGRKYLNILIVFLVSGIWHGTWLQFLVWGLLHALYQIVGECTQDVRQRLKKLAGIQEGSVSDKIYRIFITFHLVAFAWIFFRADSLAGASEYIGNMFSRYNPWVLFDGSLFNSGISRELLNVVILNIILVMLVDLAHRKGHFGLREKLRSLHIFIRWPIYFILIYDILLFGAYGMGIDPSAFLYGAF